MFAASEMIICTNKPITFCMKCNETEWSIRCILNICLTMQIINVYNQRYESAAAFWPHVHSRIIASLLISQFLLLGLLSTKKAAKSTPLLVMLPILTFAFHKYCQRRFEPAFRKYPIEVCASVVRY